MYTFFVLMKSAANSRESETVGLEPPSPGLSPDTVQGLGFRAEGLGFSGLKFLFVGHVFCVFAGLMLLINRCNTRGEAFFVNPNPETTKCMQLIKP